MLWRKAVLSSLLNSIQQHGHLPRYGLKPSEAMPASFVLTRSHSGSGASNKSTEIKKAKTPSGKFDDPFETKSEEVAPQGEREPLERFPDNKNPLTGEIGGPRGPEPTRYGDWERKGRVTDF